MTAPRIESELKYLAADERPLLHLATADRLGPARLGTPSTLAELDRYLDTADLRLASVRWACRLRTRDGRTIVSLKGPAEHAAGDPLHRRPELEGPAGSSLDAAGWPASEARDRLRALAEGQPLAERFRLAQDRTERSVTVGGEAVGILSLDRVRVLRGGREHGRLQAVELEFASGVGSDFDHRPFATVLSGVAGLTPDPMSKLEHALGMLPGG
jgi:inorganic triphosphatase YgiF